MDEQDIDYDEEYNTAFIEYHLLKFARYDYDKDDFATWDEFITS
jgi:hypothetical protein